MSRVSIRSTEHLLNRTLPAIGAGTIPGSVLSPPSDQLPEWATLIPGVKPLVARLGVSEFRRRLLHMLPGFLPCLLWIIPHRDPWGPLLINSTIGIAIGTILIAMYRAASFARSGEKQWSLAVTGYVLPVLVMLFLLPGKSELGLMTLGILALGDGSAALGGLAFGGKRLPWNHRKTWTGIICFFVAATTMSSLYYWMEARPGVPFHIALAIAGVSALLGAIVESLPIRSHDNLRVGTTAALTGILMHMSLLGW